MSKEPHYPFVAADWRPIGAMMASFNPIRYLVELHRGRYEAEASQKTAHELGLFDQICWEPLLASWCEIPDGVLDVWLTDWVIASEYRESTWEEKCAKERVDRCLDALDYMLAMQQEGGQAHDADSLAQVALADFSAHHESAALRKYVISRRRDWSVLSGLDSALGADETEYFFSYGSTMLGLGPPNHPDLTDKLQFCGTGKVAGGLYRVTDSEFPRPGLDLAGNGTVTGEVFRILDAKVMRDLDEWVGFDPSHPFSGPYRRLIRRASCVPDRDVWLYEGNHAGDRRESLAGFSDWRRYVQSVTEGDADHVD